MADPKQTAHTPWRVRRIDYPRKRDVSFEIVSGNDEDESVGYFPMPICQTIMREIKRESGLISADEFHMNRIVRCVNSHDSLVEALEAIAKLDPEVDTAEGFNEWGEAECFKKAKNLATAALQAAGRGNDASK